MSDLPKRRFSVVIECGGDTKEDAVLAIRDFADRIEAGNQIMGITGAPSFGGSYTVTEDPEMTHERYFQTIKDMKKGTAQ